MWYLFCFVFLFVVVAFLALLWQITDGALEALSAHCPSLEWLDFSWCGEVSDRGVVQLAEGCPGLEEVSVSF